MTVSLELENELNDIAERLSANAQSVDQANSVPGENLTSLSKGGLYGTIAPRSSAGLGLDLNDVCLVVEQLAAACLATTFVWLQHFRLLATLLDPATPAHLRAKLPDVTSGQLKGGVALGGLLPGPSRIRADFSNGAWRISGEAPWVSGWGMVDVLLVTTRDDADYVVSFVIEAKEQSGLVVSPIRLSAMNASSTVKVVFTDYAIANENCAGRQPYAPGLEPPAGLRVNGSLALGLARRCCDLLGSTSLNDELRRCRLGLETADAQSIGLARAQANELAVRASQVLAVTHGSQSAVYGDVAERTAREAALLLVFGSRPTIKSALLDLLSNHDVGPS